MTDADGYFNPRNSNRYIPRRLVIQPDDRDPSKEHRPLLSPTERSVTSSQATTWVNPSSSGGPRSEYYASTTTAPSAPSTTSGPPESSYYYPTSESARDTRSLYHPPSIHSISSDPEYYGAMGVQTEICREDPRTCQCGAHHSNPPPFWRRYLRGPESMIGGGGSIRGGGDYPSINSPKKTKNRCCGKAGSNFKWFLVRITALALCFLLLWRLGAFGWVKSEKSSDTDHQAPGNDDSPTTRVPMNPCPTGSSSDCTPNQFTFSHEVFTFRQRRVRHNRGGHYNHFDVRGNVLFQGASSSSSSTDKITVDVEITSNIDDVRPAFSFEVSDNEIVVIIDENNIPDSTTGRIVVTVKGVVTVPNNYKLKSLTVAVETLDIILDKGLVATTDRSSFRSVSGDVIWKTTKFPSVHTAVDLVSGNIEGEYHLIDELTLHTNSGHIDITLTPHNSKNPATFKAETTSGSIKVLTVTTAGRKASSSSIPIRDYQVTVSSISGSISGSYIFGSCTKISTMSSSQTLSLIPIDAKNPGHLDTQSKSGTLRLTFDDVLRGKQIFGTHHSISGSVNVKYPRDWEGRIRGKTISGKINVGGDGVKLIRRGGGFVGDEVEAIKGDAEEGGSIYAETVSASIDMWIG